MKSETPLNHHSPSPTSAVHPSFSVPPHQRTRSPSPTKLMPQTLFSPRFISDEQTDNSMTTTTRIRGLGALAAYLDLRCESAGHWRLATIVNKEGMIVYELSWKGRQPSRGHGFIDFGFGGREKWSKTHDELLEVWEHMI